MPPVFVSGLKCPCSVPHIQEALSQPPKKKKNLVEHTRPDLRGTDVVASPLPHHVTANSEHCDRETGLFEWRAKQRWVVGRMVLRDVLCCAVKQSTC